ncbi:DUF418 domain-containing protein [Streptomyces millisiae]|uniref:DUF418 domain-containing protein n=1 Tax=Streptomyces millisiae TaxID=3075542 RepID=A0ABU2LQT0_9ACTN|nr:DUF418 domain-containing protein [Streptomyces sp. DSM 44918]MDT0319939.1 DUF418 domain-containing protein [Streptomyces sp. DSM 44918]
MRTTTATTPLPTAEAPTVPAPAPPPPAPRVGALDALRGFALCGILLVNIPFQITRMRRVDEDFDAYPVATFLDLLVHQRFFPIFCFLFGVGFALLLSGAERRTERPRTALLRRLLALGLLGLVHQLAHPGEALLPYAVVGLLILLPASWLPTRVVLPVGLLGLVASVTLVSGGTASIPPLFLLGLAAARLGVAEALDRHTGRLAVLLALAAPAALAAGWWQHTYPPAGPYATRIAAAAGMLGALAYGTALLLVLRTGLGRRLSAVLEPLGRMALTNYLSATVAVVLAAGPLGLWDSARWGTAMALAVAVLAAQAAVSHWWLARFRHGPLEWCLRSLTWWTPARLRR